MSQYVTLFTGTTAAAAGTNVLATVKNGPLALGKSMTVYASLIGATGGTLDLYLQFSPDGGTTWVDYAHFGQLAAGASAIMKAFSVSRAGQQTTLTTVGAGTSPALGAGTVLGGDWGDQLRVLAVSGAGTTAGAAISILAVATP